MISQVNAPGTHVSTKYYFLDEELQVGSHLLQTVHLGLLSVEKSTELGDKILDYFINYVFTNFCSCIEVWLTKNCIQFGCDFLRYTTEWFNIHIQCEMITTMELINTSSPSHIFCWGENTYALLSENFKHTLLYC